MFGHFSFKACFNPDENKIFFIQNFYIQYIYIYITVYIY